MSGHRGHITGPSTHGNTIETKLQKIQRELGCSRSTAIMMLGKREPNLRTAIRAHCGGGAMTLRDTVWA